MADLFHFERHGFVISHVLGKTIITLGLDHLDAGITIGFEQELEHFGKEIIELAAFHYIAAYLAASATIIIILYGA